MGNPCGVNNADGQGRHQETGQFLPKKGTSGKQLKTAAEKGYMSGLFGEEDDLEIEDEPNEASADGRQLADIVKKAYQPTTESQDEDWEDDQDTDGTRNALDKQGGEEPTISRKALKMADFITLPDGEEGTNCSNCRYQEDGICQNNNLKGQKVNKRNCCAYWDSNGTLREWDNDTHNGFASEEQRKFMWWANPDIAEKWAHGEHTAEKDHKMPEVSGPDVKGPLAAKERERARKKGKKTENAKEEKIPPAGPNIGIDADSAEGKAAVTKYRNTPLAPRPKTLNDESDDSLQGGMVTGDTGKEMDLPAQTGKKIKKGTKIENYLLANCGGAGGTPGPCAGGEGEKLSLAAHKATNTAHEASTAARSSGMKEDHKKAAEAHVDAMIAHTRAAGAAEKEGDTTGQIMHKGMMSFHLENANRHFSKGGIRNSRMEKYLLTNCGGEVSKPTKNAWTDEAREASVAARKATMHADVVERSNASPKEKAQAHYDAATAHSMAAAHGNEGSEGMSRTHMEQGDKHMVEHNRLDSASRAVKYSREAANLSDKTLVKGLDSEANRVSQAAYKDTTKTKTYDTVERHSIAAQSHRTAALLHQSQADKASASSSDERRAMAKQHLDAASAHRAAARMHEDASKFTKNAWSEEARQAASEARQASSHAAEKTNATSGGRGIAANPAEHSISEGAHDTAARSHENMAFAHFQAAQKAKESGNVDEAKTHMQAAKAHDQARQAHEKAHAAGAWSNTRNTSGKILNSLFPEGDMNKAQRKIIIAGLTANCSCQEDKAAITNMSDEALTTLFINAGKKKKMEEEDEDEDDSELEENGGAKAEGSNADVTGGTGFAQAGGKGTKDEYKLSANKRQSLQEWEATAPPEVVHNWNLVQQHVQQIKEQKARKLVANIANKERQDIQFKKLMKKSPEELDELLGLMATHNVRTPAPPPIYLGQSVANAMKNDDDKADSDILPLPSMNMLEDEKRKAQ